MRPVHRILQPLKSFSLPALDLHSIIWSTEDIANDAPSAVSLPPQEILDEIQAEFLDMWRRSPKQDSATQRIYGLRTSPSEPNVHLYCPIEGGDYILDDTVRELARRSHADVVVLDSVHMAAGKHGRYPVSGLPKFSPSQNPLGGRRTRTSIPGFVRFMRWWKSMDDDDSDSDDDDDYEEDDVKRVPRISQAVFDKFVNLTVHSKLSSSHPTTRPESPRIIYVRDFPVLSPWASSWYPALEAAVRARNHRARSNGSAAEHPTVIVFGSAPSPLRSLDTDKERDEGNVNMDSVRDERLKKRLERVKRGLGHLKKDVPRLDLRSPGRLRRTGERAHGWIVSTITHRKQDAEDRKDEHDELGFSLTKVVMPVSRTLTRERDARIARRREINVLVMRMAVGRAGGSLPGLIDEEGEMWESWGRQLDGWQAMKRLGNRVVSQARSQSLKTSDQTTPIAIEWAAVQRAWLEKRAARDAEKGLVAGTIEVDRLVDDVKADRRLDKVSKRLLKCIVDRSAMNTTFEDINLPLATVDAVRTVASLPLLHPDAFTHGVLRGHATTGCLLFGPPGTGKTMLVRALAREAGTRMIAIAPSDVNMKYLGESEKVVRAVFSLARRLAPCIVFIDEVDAIFAARSAVDSGASQARHSILAQFLQEMDGLTSSNQRGVMVFGATNRPFDLDDAVLRRLPRRLFVDLPTESERLIILKKLLEGETLAPDVKLAKIAKETTSFSGSDLSQLAVAAALSALKEAVHLPWKTTEVQVTRESRSPSPAIFLQEPDGSSTDARSLTPDRTEFSDNASSATKQGTPSNARTSTEVIKPSADAVGPRIICARHFDKALQDVSASTSEHVGSLSHLRRWNNEFGEGAGRRKQKAHQLWVPEGTVGGLTAKSSD